MDSTKELSPSGVLCLGVAGQLVRFAVELDNEWSRITGEREAELLKRVTMDGGLRVEVDAASNRVCAADNENAAGRAGDKKHRSDC